MSQNHLQLHLRKCSLHKNYSDVYPGEVVKRPFRRWIRRDAVSVWVVSQATENKRCAIVVHKCQNFGGGLKEGKTAGRGPALRPSPLIRGVITVQLQRYIKISRKQSEYSSIYPSHRHIRQAESSTERLSLAIKLKVSVQSELSPVIMCGCASGCPEISVTAHLSG